MYRHLAGLGLNFRPEIWVTFLTCTIGFTMGMLFDERKFSYHLMLQYFQKSGALQAFFKSFDWALSIQGLGKTKEKDGSDLPGNLDALCETWLMLLERLVNVRNIMQTPHTIMDKSPQGKTNSNAPFDPISFLLETHKAALGTLKKLWSSEKLFSLSARTCESVIAILCYLIHGEKLIKQKLLKKQTPTDEEGPSREAGASTSRIPVSEALTRSAPTESQHFQQLIDMGFSRPSVMEALMHTQTLEAATEWILLHPQPSEEDQLMQAISMSLEQSNEGEEEKPETDVKAEPTTEEKPSTSTDDQMKEESDRYLKGLEIDALVDGLLDGCLRLIDHFPDSVFRVYELYDAVMKRNGPDWTEKTRVYDVILDEISKDCDRLLYDCQALQATDETKLFEQMCDSANNKKLSIRCILLSLLFQARQFSDICSNALNKSQVISKLVQLLAAGASCLSQTREHTTPDWIAFVTLLIDLYECACTHKKRMEVLVKYKDTPRVWKWFDDRLSRWCNYNSANQAILDEAYRSGVSKIVFPAGRKRYSVNFLQMIQVNEESGNRRPVMIMFTKDKSKPPAEGDEATEVTDMETDSAEVGETPATGVNCITQEQARSLLHSCTMLLKIPVSKDALHAVMRLLLRLTRSDSPGGHDRAIQFVRLEGPQALLALTKKSDFVGFLSLATLIFCHIFEDDETLRHAMEKVVRLAAQRGIPNPSSGVSSSTLGNRELYYVLQALAPMACRKPETFVDACKTNLRLCLPNVKVSRNSDIEEEETRMLTGNGVQILEPTSKDLEQRTHSKLGLNPTTKHILQLLLNALICSSGFKVGSLEPTKPHSKSASSVMTFAQQLRQVGDDINRRYSESEAATVREQERVGTLRQFSSQPPTNMEEGAGSQQSQEMEEVFGPALNDNPEPETGAPKQGSDKDMETLLFRKSDILRLLAELVSSYPASANFIVYHTYPASISPLITQDCSCLAFILHHLLPPLKESKKEETPDGNATNAKSEQSKDCCSSLAKMLLTSIVCSQPKPSVLNTVISEVKSSLHQTLALPESHSKHNALRALLGLISNMIECATKMAGVDHNQPMNENLINVVKVMINKGLATDLAQVTNHIDLGSPHMAESVNAALKPLEILSRFVHHSSAPNTPKPSCGCGKGAGMSSDGGGLSSEAPADSSQMEQNEENLNEQNPEDGGMTSNDEMYHSSADPSYNSALGSNVSIGETFMITEQDPERFHHDLMMSESTDHDDGGEEEEEDDEDGEDEVVDINIEDDHVDDDVDEDQDSTGSDDQTEHNDDQDLEDDGSEMEDLDEDDDDDDDDDDTSTQLNYETFVYDLLNETSDSNILLQLEDVLSDGFVPPFPHPLIPGNVRSSQLFATPFSAGDDNSNTIAGTSSSWIIPTTHPLLTRVGRHTSPASVSVTAPTTSRNAYGNNVTASRSGQTLQIEFTSNSQDAPHILTRLLGPVATSDVLQLSNSLYNEGGGHAQLVVNSNNIQFLQSNNDISNTTPRWNLSTFCGPNASVRQGSGTMNVVPTALSRWTQACEVLEPDSVQYCLLGLRQEITDALERRCESDIQERRKKRAADKEKAELEKRKNEGKKEEEKGQEERPESEESEPATSPQTDVLPAPPSSQNDTPQEVSPMDSGAAGISTPTNTPIATRPDSPANEQQAAIATEVDPIDALQQASSSLQSVSLESNHEDEDVTETTDASATDVPMPQAEAGARETDESEEPSGGTDEGEEMGEQAEGGTTEATSEQGASSSTREEGGEFEGVDPSFLAALPDDIRQEVIREQLSRQGQRRTNAPENQTSGVSPEFLAALPPSIQQEVLLQERAEQARAAQQENSNDPVDPTVFIQTLPSSLRQSVLADMDDSLVAVLPADLAAEAQELRASMERRQQRYFPERFFSPPTHHSNSNILPRSVNLPSRFRYGGNPSVWGSMPGTSRSRPPAQVQQNVKVQVRQLLSHDSLACMLLLLFVKEPKLNLARLHRVLRNLSFHVPTRYWLVCTLIAILQRAAKVKQPSIEEKGAEEAMDYKTTPTSVPVKQKPPAKLKGLPVKFMSDRRNTSWLSIRLDAALGSRASIFQVTDRGDAPESGARRKENPKQTPANQSIFIHPQAAPIVCRQTIDTLLMLAKIFPRHFVNVPLHVGNVGQARSKFEPLETDFWDALLRLETLTFSSELTKKNPAEDKKVPENTSHDIEATCMGELLRMLAHPVLERSQQLTDSLLNLLAQISMHLPAQSKTGVAQGNQTSGKSEDAQKGDDADDRNNDANSREEGSSTATMGARACTSNTSTVGQASMDTKTATTGSNQSLGSISVSAVALECLCTTPLEKELELAVRIMTSHACSEEGLGDATTLLINLYRTEPTLRDIIVRLLLQGAQKIGHTLYEQIVTLSREMEQYAQELSDQEMATSDSNSGKERPSTSSSVPTGSSTSRFQASQMLSLTGKTKLKPTGKELQLPIMQVLTSKTSTQAFFLRLLKVIIQLQKNKKQEKRQPENRRRQWHSVFSNSVIRNAFAHIAQADEEFSNALADMVGPPSPAQTTEANPESSGDKEEETIVKEAEGGEVADPRSLCEKLQLDSLWEILGTCLKQLEESNDPHAVLVLQPTVEAFFLVHATKQATTKNPDPQKENESQLAHLDLQPLSPSMSAEAASQPSVASQSAEDINPETKKFLDFADTHRSMLNQILRQSNVPLTEGPFSVLVNHTKVLDFDVKRQHFRQELERLEESSISRRDDIAIRVRRQHVFEDSFRELHRRSPEELKSRLYIVFEGEEGQDAGGLLREWYLIISREIFNPMYALFRTSPGDRVTYTINPASYINSNHLSYFKFVGGIVAKAIYDNKLLDCYFTRSFYKHILGKPVRYQDMESEDYSFSQGLVFLLENDVSLFGTELNFSVEIMEFGKTETRDLKPDGRNIQVTEETKKEYVHLVCQEKMTGAIRQQLSAFLEGFYEIIPKRLISIFDEQELELLISGLPTVDIEDLRNNTEYHKYETSSLQIQWFWRALKSFDQAERAKFLQFVTGTSKVPLQGFAHLEGMTGAQKFQIHRDSRSTSRLPCAHTCFNQLDLPAYETYDKLRHMLLLAINECQEGFGLA